MGLREVHAQAAPRHWQEGRLPVRRVVQEDHGLTQSPATTDQIASAHTAYCASPGCRSSDAIHPGVPMPEVLAWAMSTQVKLRARASSSAMALKTPVRFSTRSFPPKSAAAGT